MITPNFPQLTLVEDNSYDEELTISGIHKSGVPCNITVRRDGQEALEFLLGASSLPSLILMDFKLPKLNGLEVLTQLKLVDRTRYIPVVIFSGSNVGSVIKDCYRIGANSCVTKPVDAAEYVGLVKSITYYWLGVNKMAQDESNFLSHRINRGANRS
jgi:two-component system response regulator